MTEKNKMNSMTNIPFSKQELEKLKENFKVKLFDRKDDLELFSYVDLNSDFPKQCRGLIYNGDELLVRTFPHTCEYTISDTEKLEKIFSDGFNEDYTFFESHEGSLIRVFHFNGKWYVSTHKKIDAFESRWSSKKSFGELFVEALENEYNVNKDFNQKLGVVTNVFDSFLETLDKDKVYTFLLRNNNENRIVCDAPDYPTLYHAGTFCNNELSLDEDISITYPKRLKFSTLKDLLDYVKNIEYTKLQGVIIFNKNNIVCKVINSEYSEFFKLRGNEGDIRFRYLQLRNNSKKINDLYFLYPRFVEIFDDCEDVIVKIIKWIMTKYVDRFIKKQYVTVPREEYNVIKACHNWHMEDRKRNRISFRKIKELVDTQDPDILYRMVKRYKQNSYYQNNNNSFIKNSFNNYHIQDKNPESVNQK